MEMRGDAEMTRMRWSCCGLLLAASTLLAGGALAGEPSIAPEVAADAEALVGHYEALATLLEAHSSGTCDALAVALDEFVAGHGTDMHAVAGRLAALDAAAEAALQ